MKKIRIDRKKWRRDHNGQFLEPTKTFLWDKTRQLGCCLGHLIHQTTKCSWKELDGIALPQLFYNPKTNNKLVSNGFATNFTDEASTINDKASRFQPDREAALIKLFAENGFELEFFN